MMNNRTLSVLILAASGVIFQNCQSPDSSNTADTIQTAMFIGTVAERDMLEVTLGKLAQEKANHPAVKNFGKLMVQDHNQMNDRLKTLAVVKGLKLPRSLPAKESEQVHQMRQMKTAYFEKLYMKMMIESHNKDIELFKGADNSPDTAIRNFSRQFLPVLETHRDNALKVSEGIKD